MAASLPSGIGNPQQAQQATAFMRQQPWYASLVTSWGLDPSKTDANGNLLDPRTGQSAKLSDTQQQQLIATARDNGIGISNSYNIDENGQIAKPDSHMLRNIAIAAGIAGLAVTGLGAAGIGPLAGVFGAGADAAATGTGLAADGTLASTTVGSGFVPAIAGGVGTDVAGTLGTGASLAGLSAGPLATGETGMAATDAATAVPSSLAAPTGTAATSVLGTGGKLASLASNLNGLGTSLQTSGVSPQGSAYAALANQLANNRNTAAKTDQGGPAADKLALQNGERASLIAGMDPNAAPLSLGGHALPTLANADSVSYAAALKNALAARLAAGKTPTTFGVADPTAEELNADQQAQNAAGIGTGLNSDLATIGNTLKTGAQVANLTNNAFGIGKQVMSWF